LKLKKLKRLFLLAILTVIWKPAKKLLKTKEIIALHGVLTNIKSTRPGLVGIASAYTHERTIAITDFKKPIKTIKDLEIIKL